MRHRRRLMNRTSGSRGQRQEPTLDPIAARRYNVGTLAGEDDVPDDDDKQRYSFLDRGDVLLERCLDSCERRWIKAKKTSGTGRARLVLAGMLLLLLFIVSVIFDVGIRDLAAVVLMTVVVGLVFLASQLLMARATVTIGPNNAAEATMTAQTGTPGLPAGTTARTPRSSRTWLRSWPWQTVLTADRIEVKSFRRPPVVISLRRVARITLAIYPTEHSEALTLMDGAGETIAQVVQDKFAVAFLAALAKTTGREIEFLPLSGGRPSLGGPW